jgi:glucose/arabinose dehydrogenase
MLRVALLCAVTLLGCKRPGNRATGADGTPVVATVAPRVVPAAVVDAAPAPDLPPPSEKLSAPPDLRLQLVEVASGLDRPVALVAPPGDTRRLFVVEQVGRIRVLEDGKLKPGAFLDIKRDVSRANEQGLLGLAFHPRFADNHRLYINFTDRRGDTNIVEYIVDADDPDRASLASARTLLRVEQPYSNHNGGHLVFGPDGKLWIGLGDGGAANDPHEHGQNDRSLLGKMLRLDVDADRAQPEIVAKGLRNPWRYAFDAKTGDLYIGDVGQNAWEMIYVVPAAQLTGHNFGWNVTEGRHCFLRDDCDRSPFTPPVTDYDHRTGCSVTGGVVYRGKAIPELDGVYFYADYCTAIIRSFVWRPDGIRSHWEWKPMLDPASRLSQVSSFGVDHEGELYVLLLGGDLLKLVQH